MSTFREWLYVWLDSTDQIVSTFGTVKIFCGKNLNATTQFLKEIWPFLATNCPHLVT